MKIVSLKLKLFISTALVCSIIILMTSALNLFQHRKREYQRIEKEFLNFERGAEQAIRKAVWIFDWDMVQTILENQTSQVVSFIEVCDQKKSTCLQHGVRDQIPYQDFRTSILSINGDINKDVEIGSIYLQSHYEGVPYCILHHLPQLLLTNGLSVFGVALILLYLFDKLVIRRLLKLEYYTRKIDPQKISSLIIAKDLPRDKTRDEIDLLEDALRGLIIKTKDELERRQSLERQLNQNNKMKALGNLASGIAHDFNNILAAIIGYAELSFFKTKPGTELYSNVENIIKAGNRACDLTSQILLFSRRTESIQEDLFPAYIVDEALNLVRVSLTDNIEITTDLDYEARIKGDSSQLHQVIMNVATNGLHAMENKGGTLSLKVRNIPLSLYEAEKLLLPEGAYCCLEIIDEGPGIPKDIKTRIFEPFFTTKNFGKGTGMGLAVVHGIVQNHNGAITIESQSGKGTHISIYFPQSTEIRVEKESESIVKDVVTKGRGQQILLVDDDLSILDMGVSVLEKLGYTVVSFDNPEEALFYIKQGTPIDLVITDLTMPQINGVELAQQLKLLYPQVPVILWTGFKNDSALEGLETNLINSIIQKPITMKSLAIEVTTVLASENKL